MLQTIFNVMTVANFIVLAGLVIMVIVDAKTDSEDEYDFYLDSMKPKKKVSREKNTTKGKTGTKSKTKPASKAKATKKATVKRPNKVQRPTARKNS